MFVPPAEMIVFESEHWLVNHRVDTRLPGYLVMAPRNLNAVTFSTITAEALTEMGAVLGRVTRVMEEQLRPQNLYVSRYGHTGGHNLHFHIIPVYAWLAKEFRLDERYHVLRQFDTPGVANSGQEIGFDGAEMTLFVWREYTEGSKPLPEGTLSVSESVDRLRRALDESSR